MVTIYPPIGRPGHAPAAVTARPDGHQPWQLLASLIGRIHVLDPEAAGHAAVWTALAVFPADTVELRLPWRCFRASTEEASTPSAQVPLTYDLGSRICPGELRLYAQPSELTGAHRAALAVFVGAVAAALGNATRHRRIAAVAEYHADQAAHDPLTGLANLRRLHQHTAGGVAGTRLLAIDLDNFKRVNDVGGHRLGDRVLADVAWQLRDAFPAALAVRLGGDEFAILWPAGLAARRPTAGDLRRPVHIDAAGVAIAASVGFAVGGPADDLGDLLDRADREMYAAKRLRGRRRGDVTEVLQPLTLQQLRTTCESPQADGGPVLAP